MGITFDCRNSPETTLSWAAKKVGPVFITARSLFLNENVNVHVANLASSSMAWNHGTYTQDLELTDAVLNSWSGKQLLDVGAGASLFAEEAKAAYNINVTNLDLNISRDAPYLDALQISISPRRATILSLPPHVSQVTGKDYLRTLYTRNLEWLWCSHKPTISSDAALMPAFDKVFNLRYDIAGAFFANANNRVAGNATTRTAFAKNSFDILISVWVFNYLDTQTKKSIIKNMIHWSKPTGQIRIYGGQNDAEGSNQDPDLTPSSFRQMFSSDKYQKQDNLARSSVTGTWSATYKGKTFFVNPRSSNRLLIVDIASS